MHTLALIVTLAASQGISSRPARAKLPTDPVLKEHLQGKTVLAIGDSMIVTGLEIWLRKVVRKHGGKLKRWAWASSTTRKWATTGAVRRALRKHRPDVVIVVLGSNELYLDHPEKRARYVKTMLRRIEPRPYRWLGPPVWNTQTGIVDMMAKTIPDGRFYRFNGRKIGRHKDGRHPSVYGSRTWTYDFVRWWIRRLKAERRQAAQGQPGQRRAAPRQPGQPRPGQPQPAPAAAEREPPESPQADRRSSAPLQAEP